MNIEEIHAPPSFDGSEGLLAIVVSHDYQGEPGLSFFTAPSYTQQVAYMRHPAGRVIDRHLHPEIHRSIHGTQETLVVRSGRLRADIYTSGQHLVCQRELVAGDVLILLRGGHGFLILEDSEILEVKTGPYAGAEDKVRF